MKLFGRGIFINRRRGFGFRRIQRLALAVVAEQEFAGKLAVVEKIVAGKLEKYFQDVALVDQPFIKDDKRRIRDLLADTGKAAGGEVKIVRFARFKVGEA